MTPTNNNELGFLSECEKEPIHIPGSVQPFGVLLTIDPRQHLIQNVSENCEALWGMAAIDLLGHSLLAFVPASEVGELAAYLQKPDLKEQSPLPVRLALKDGRESRWELSAHSYQEVLFLEFEPAAELPAATDAAGFHYKLRAIVQALQRTGSLQALCDAAAQQVRDVTGFDRAMVYRFDADWHGVVVAEARDPRADSYLGHHFPASDIPAQARAIFLQNWLRMIPDVDYQPSRIYPGQHPESSMPLDLSQAMLRSVSPIHLQYLRNMGVRASLTVSLLDEGRLWGLIACHHEQPLRINADGRIAAQLVGQIASAQIRLKESLEDLDYKRQLQQTHARLVAYMEREEDLIEGLVKHSPNMLDIAAADGAAAAIYYDNRWTVIGKTPSIEHIENLVSRLSLQHPQDQVFCTDSLCRHFPEAAAYKEVASGLLAIAIPKSERNYILWFRPEVASTVIWAGNPDKPLDTSSGHATLHPRASFQSWRQVVTGKSLPWKAVEIEAVKELRNSIIALDLRREFQREQAARATAEKLGREKEDMVMMVSHDLRTPLSVAKMGFEYLQRFRPDDDAAIRGMVSRGIRATQAMEKLITDILDVAKIEAGTLALNMRPESANDLLREALDMFQPIAQEKGVRLAARIPERSARVCCEKNRITQVLSNLISNAVKFTGAGGAVTLTVAERDNEAVFSVADTGNGIPPQNLEKIFDRFWQAEQTRRLGTGLGLSIAKGIVEKHQGQIWAESEVGVGTSFFFSLPKASA